MYRVYGRPSIKNFLLVDINSLYGLIKWCLGLFQGWSIIHAVARHSNDVADAVVAILLVGLRSG